MKNLLVVFTGGGAGSIVRYLLGKWVTGLSGTCGFPYGTFVVNILACLVLGIVVAMADEKNILSPNMRLLLAVGFCGGFSTFSTFSGESLMLFQKGETMTALAYIFASVLVCLLSTFAGMWAVRQFV
jgi:CrcB protein